jgi:hypothetical protein
MFVNPQSIKYNHKKAIIKERTKGGYSLQYWGEELSILDITGTTGSSGIEGINMLYEIYRAEQYAFDSVGLDLDANNAFADISNGPTIGINVDLGLGLDSTTSMLSPRNVPSLASLAFSVEMHYNGWIYRGYFESMSIDESASNFLFNYNIKFTVTQRRGYRTNYFPWQLSPTSGASNYDTPHSFSGNVVDPQPQQSLLGALLIDLL